MAPGQRGGCRRRSSVGTTARAGPQNAPRYAPPTIVRGHRDPTGKLGAGCAPTCRKVFSAASALRICSAIAGVLIISASVMQPPSEGILIDASWTSVADIVLSTSRSESCAR